jgi:hypothetical protein
MHISTSYATLFSEHLVCFRVPEHVRKTVSRRVFVFARLVRGASPFRGHHPTADHAMLPRRRYPSLTVSYPSTEGMVQETHLWLKTRLESWVSKRRAPCLEISRDTQMLTINSHENRRKEGNAGTTAGTREELCDWVERRDHSGRGEYAIVGNGTSQGEGANAGAIRKEGGGS